MKNLLLHISKEIPSVKNAVHIIEPYLFEIPKYILISDEQFYNIMICVTEAVNNAIVHGNKCQEEKNVLFELKLSEDILEIEVHDHGSGFDPDSVDDPRDPENLFKSHGRGIFIMKNLMDEVEYKSNSEGSKLFLRLFLKNKKV